MPSPGTPVLPRLPVEDSYLELLADTLLAALGANLFIYLREVREMPIERLKSGWGALVRGALPAGAEGAFV